MSPWIVEGVRSALRPRGIGPAGAHMPSVCAALWHLSLLRSGTRLLFACVSDGGAPCVRASGPPASPTEPRRATRSSRPPAGVPRAPPCDGSGFPPPTSIRQTRRRDARPGPSVVMAALHRLWAVACGTGRDVSAGPGPLAELTHPNGARISSIGSALRGAPGAPARPGAAAVGLARRHRPADADRGRDRRIGLCGRGATNASAVCAGSTATRSPRCSGI
jgi:hypothetical protein